MPERQNRNVRHLAFRDAQISRNEARHRKVDPNAAPGQRATKRHGWPFPEKPHPEQDS
jgi:hypothetical protein